MAYTFIFTEIPRTLLLLDSTIFERIEQSFLLQQAHGSFETLVVLGMSRARVPLLDGIVGI